MQEVSATKNKELILLLSATVLFCILIAGVYLFRSSIKVFSLSDANKSIKPIQYSADAFVNGKLNINGAPVEDLMLLPGIGQTLAEQIVEYRENNGPYTNIIELMLVEGIEQTKFDKIKNYITVGD